MVEYYGSMSEMINTSAIAKGKDAESVIESFSNFISDAHKMFSKSDNNFDSVFSSALSIAVYAIYLKGVEDGMKGD